MSRHWIVVADGAVSRVYDSDALLQELTLIDRLRRDHAHLSHGDGRANTPVPGAGHGSHEAQHDHPREREERLARALGGMLDEAERERRFDRLILAAPPRFLGDLRASMGENASRRIVASFNHDWTKLGLDELSATILKNLPPDAGKGLD